MEERISKLEDRALDLTSSDQRKDKRMKNSQDSLRDLEDNIKQTTICIIRVQEEERERDRDRKFISRNNG